jgi:hypothetical protein
VGNFVTHFSRGGWIGSDEGTIQRNHNASDQRDSMRSNMVNVGEEREESIFGGEDIHSPWGGEEDERDNQGGGGTDKAYPPWTSPFWPRMVVTDNTRWEVVCSGLPRADITVQYDIYYR